MGVDNCIDCDKRKAAEDCNCVPVENADGTLQDIVMGCTNSLATNYNPLANCDDGSCILKNPGCMDPEALNYSSCFNTDCDGNIPGSAAYITGGTYGVDTCCCTTAGCMDPNADNYNAAACIDDGSCIYSGCTDFTACNYVPLATVDDGSCVYPSDASYTEQACGSYSWGISGQTYTTSGTYTHVGTNASGCPHTDTLNLTINQATTGTVSDTGCLTYTWSGPQGNGTTYTSSGTYTSVTTNASGCNHTETLNLTIIPDGCTDPSATNYDPAACADDGSCVQPNPVAPVFKTNVTQGTCGADSVPPAFTGSVNDTYTYNGHYCDEDHVYSDVTLTSEYSTDGGTTYTPGLPAGWTLQKDLAGGALGNNQFKLTGPVSAGQTIFKLRVEDPGGLFSEQLVTVSALYQMLQNVQFQLSYPHDTIAAGMSKTPTATVARDINIYTADNTVGNLTLPGPPLWNRTQIPTVSGGTYGTANGIVADGGTYGGLGAGTTFSLFRRSEEIGASLETCGNPNNIAVGQTILFNAATIETAFANAGMGGVITGNLEFTIIEEDIAHAPLSSVSIALAQESKSGHTCGDGGFRLQASCVNGSGQTVYRKSRKVNTANVGGLKIPGYSIQARWSNTNWDPPADFDSYGNNAWTRGQPGSYAIHTNDIDMTDGGWVTDSKYHAGTNNYGYFQSGVTWDDYSRTTGTFALSDSIISDLSSQSFDGKITIKLIGDHWRKCGGSGNFTTVATVDGNGGILTVGPLTGTGTGYGAPNTNHSKYYLEPQTGSGSGAFVKATVTSSAIATLGTVHFPGENYQVGDVVELDGENSWMANAHGDACVLRVFREDPSNPGQHIEIGLNPVNGNALYAGDGNAVEIDLFNNTINIV